MMRVLIIILAISFAFVAPIAQAAQVTQVAMECGDHTKGMTELKERYAEEPVSMGLASDGSVVEIFTSDAGTFTIVITKVDGVSCMIAAGDNWEKMQSQLKGTKI